MNANLQPSPFEPPHPGRGASTSPINAPFVPKLPAAAARRPAGIEQRVPERSLAQVGRLTPTVPRHTRLYVLAAAIFVIVGVIGYFGFREYIYGDQIEPSAPVAPVVTISPVVTIVPPIATP